MDVRCELINGLWPEHKGVFGISSRSRQGPIFGVAILILAYILTAQARQEGKPDNIVEKMVQGRLRKYLAEITLVGQPFVKDPDITVGKLLDKTGASVTGFVRYAVGEGIEKKADNFVEEVMAQVSQSQ